MNKCDRVGTDMDRSRVSDSPCRQSSGSDNAVSSLKLIHCVATLGNSKAYFSHSTKNKTGES